MRGDLVDDVRGSASGQREGRDRKQHHEQDREALRFEQDAPAPGATTRTFLALGPYRQGAATSASTSRSRLVWLSVLGRQGRSSFSTSSALIRRVECGLATPWFGPAAGVCSATPTAPPFARAEARRQSCRPPWRCGLRSPPGTDSGLIGGSRVGASGSGRSADSGGSARARSWRCVRGSAQAPGGCGWSAGERERRSGRRGYAGRRGVARTDPEQVARFGPPGGAARCAQAGAAVDPRDPDFRAAIGGAGPAGQPTRPPTRRLDTGGAEPGRSGFDEP
jgi:hypothetical protein